MLSKLGACSRSEAERWVRAGRVAVDGRVVLDPETPTAVAAAGISIDDAPVASAGPVYVVYNKPRGLVVSAADEHRRDTVFDALHAAGLPWLGAVGRLDKASEGMLLFSNDTRWAATITTPASHLDKTYHVQVDCLPGSDLLAALVSGADDRGEFLRAKHVRILRSGQKHAWLEIVLDEGRNRQIRRLLAVHGVAVLRLVRVAIGGLELGTLEKGAWRHLDAAEVNALARPSR